MKELLNHGITVMAHADTWFKVHIGASLVAAYFMLEEKLVPSEIEECVLERAELMKGFFPELSQPVEFEGPHNPDALKRIVEDLEKSVDDLCYSGHRTIFLALFLRAVKEMPELINDALVDGMLNAVAFITPERDKPGRYGDNQQDWKERIQDISEKESYSSESDMVEACYKALETVWPNHENSFLMGEILHSLTFAQAVLDLKKLGYSELAERAMRTHKIHLTFATKAAVPQGLEPLEEGYLFTEKAFWDHVDEHDFHAIKLSYAVLSLLPYCDENRKKDFLKRTSKLADERIRAL